MEGSLVEKGSAPRVVGRRVVGLFGFNRFGNCNWGLNRDGSDCRLRLRSGKRVRIKAYSTGDSFH